PVFPDPRRGGVTRRQRHHFLVTVYRFVGVVRPTGLWWCFPSSCAGGLTMEKREEKKGRFHIENLEERIAPTIVAVNGGGNTPNGAANRVAPVNPTGHAPPGPLYRPAAHATLARSVGSGLPRRVAGGVIAATSP